VLLPQLGPEGQARLAENPVCFEGFGPDCEALHLRAGGALEPKGLLRVTAPEALRGVSLGPAEALALDAFGAVEAARRVLGEPARGLPAAVLARLR
jgi:hypothetical protein